MSKEPFRVTDHAVIRYLERAMGLNIEIVRQHIEGICRGPAAVGAVSVRAEGVRFEIVNNAVITVAPDRINPSNTGRRMAQDKIQRREREKQERDLGLRRYVWPVAAGDGADARAVPEPGPAGFPAGTFTDTGGDASP